MPWTSKFHPLEISIALLSLKIKQPLLRIIPGLAEVDTDPQEKAFREAFSLIRRGVAVCKGGSQRDPDFL